MSKMFNLISFWVLRPACLSEFSRPANPAFHLPASPAPRRLPGACNFKYLCNCCKKRFLLPFLCFILKIYCLYQFHFSFIDSYSSIVYFLELWTCSLEITNYLNIELKKSVLYPDKSNAPARSLEHLVLT